MSRLERERGAATVFVLAIIGVVLAAGVIAAMAAAAVLTRHRAAVAADAAALAAASTVVAGASSACGTAARVAGENGARLASCAVGGSTVEVSVAVRPPGCLAWLDRVGRLGEARLNARAGPAETYGEKPAPLDGSS
jgi:secretion/DNA translocation related TadE-like protein